MSSNGKNYVIAFLCTVTFFLVIEWFCTYDIKLFGHFIYHYDDRISEAECKIVNEHNIVIYKILDNGKYEEYKELHFPAGDYIFRTIRGD